MASFLLGGVNNLQRYVSSSTNAQERQKRFFWYGQDEWRVTPKLTATLGLRWEMVFPETVNAPGNGSTLNLSNGLMYVFGEGGVSSHGIQTMNWHKLRPQSRLGLPGKQKDRSPRGLWLVIQPGDLRLHVRPQRDPEPAGLGLPAGGEPVLGAVRRRVQSSARAAGALPP